MLALILPFVFVPFLAFAAQLQARPHGSQGHASAALEIKSESATTCLLGLQTPHPSLPSDAGACWIRVALLWDLVEPEEKDPRSYDWTAFDAELAGILQGEANVIAVLAGNPPWASAYPGGPVTDTMHLTGFLSAAVERYDADGLADAPGSPRVGYWELYNEPDLQNEDIAASPEGRYFGFWGGKGAEYAQMLASVYPAIKAADATGQVVFGGVAHEVVGDHPGNFDLAFVDEVLAYIRDQPGDYFDIMNFHYYIVFDVNYMDWGPDIMGKAAHIRQTLLSYGMHKPLLCTEAGTWSSGGPSFRPGSHEEQSRYVVQLYSRSYAAQLGTSIWFDYRIGAEDHGLLDENLNPKPAYNAYRTFATRLQGASYDGPLFSYEPPQGGECWWPLPRREGYAFTLSSGQRLYVVWKNVAPQPPAGCLTGQISETLQIRAMRVTVLDKFDPTIDTVPPVAPGEPMTIHDGDDGQVDLLVTIPIAYDPIYIYIEQDTHRNQVPLVLRAH